MADNDPSQNQSDTQDYDKVVTQKPSSTSVGSNKTTDRDLGTVGGGTLPGSKLGSGPPQGGMSTTNDSVSGQGTTEADSITDRSDVKDSGKSAASSNIVDKHAQANAGGRDPSQPQTSMGDRDSKMEKEGRADTDI